MRIESKCSSIYRGAEFLLSVSACPFNVHTAYLYNFNACVKTLLQIPIRVSAWDCMGIDGNPWKRVGNNKIPCRNPCESAWGEIVCMVAHKGSHTGLYGMKFPTQETTRETV